MHIHPADSDAGTFRSELGDGEAPGGQRLRSTIHELRNAVNMLMGGLHVLSAESTGPLVDKQARLVDRMDDRVRRMSELLDDLDGEAAASRGRVCLPRLTGAPVAAAGVTVVDDGTGPVKADGATVAAPEESGPRRTSRGLESTPAVGELVDDAYRLEQVIGRGGMGTVFRACDVRLERDVALKIVSGTAWPSEASRRSFLEEARTLARVWHPNVVAVHALGTYGDNPYLVMELIDGVNLRQLLRGRGEALGLDEALAMLEQLCRGVSAIHRAGSLHRDLKPSNVLIGPAFRVAIADFGLALPLGRSGADSLRGGTPGYSAPEVFSSELSDLTERVDVYGLGALAYECLTGERPFEGASASEIVEKQERGQVRSPGEVRADLPPQLAEVIAACLAPMPEQRPRSVNVLRSALTTLHQRDFEGRRIDVVDDDEDVRDATMQLIRGLLPGCEVRGFADGEAAAAAVVELPPDLLIVDLDMPRMNGRELTALVRGDPRTSGISVLVITGVGSGRDWEMLKRIGADAFLVKPVDAQSLGALARSLVTQSDLDRPRLSQATG